MADTVSDRKQHRLIAGELSQVLALGPEFLSGRRDADEMAHTMVRTVRDYVERQRAVAPGGAHDQAPRELNAVMSELYACGSGYLADRCDAACVARTMTQIVKSFGSADTAG